MHEATITGSDEWEPHAVTDASGFCSRYRGLAILESLDAVVIQSLKASGIHSNALVTHVGDSSSSSINRWRSSGHLGELIAIELNIEESAKEEFLQPEACRNGSVDVVTSNLAMYHVPPLNQPNAHRQIKSLLKPVTGIYAEITRGLENKRGIHADDVLIGMALKKVMGQSVSIPAPIHHAYTIDSAMTQLPEHYEHVYMYRQSSDIRLTTNEEIDIKLGCHKSIRDLYVTSDGKIPTPEQHSEAIEIAIGGKVLRAREGLEPIRDYVEEALFLASDSSVNRAEFKHNFTVLK